MAWAQPLAPPPDDRPPIRIIDQADLPPRGQAQQQQQPAEVPVFHPGPSENYVLVEYDDAGEVIPLDGPSDVAAIWHVPMTDEEREKVREVVELRQQLLDAGVIRRFAKALDMVRARGEEPVTALGSITNNELGLKLAKLSSPMQELTRRGTLLNDPDIRSWMTMDQLTELGRIYRGWQGIWVARAQQELREAQAAGAPIENSTLMPGSIDHVRKMLEFEASVHRSLFRQYRAGEEGFFDDVRSLDLSSDQRAEIDRIQSVDDVDDLRQFLRVALALTVDQNRQLIIKRNPDTWESMLLPPKLATVPEGVEPELPQLGGDGIEYALVSFGADGRLDRLESEPDLAALRALDLPQDTRRRTEEIVAEREAVFDLILADLAEEVIWLCAAAPVEEMTELEMLINQKQVIDPIRSMGSLMRAYYGRGDLIHDAEIKATLTSEQHAEMSAIYDRFATAFIAQVNAQVEAGREAGLEIRESDVRQGAPIHLLRMKDFVRKSRVRLAQMASVDDPQLPEQIRSADLPQSAITSIESTLAALEDAQGQKRIDLFWDILTTLTPEQAMRVLGSRLAREHVPADG